MASPPPTNLEDTQDLPADKPTTKSLGPSLDSLTPEQLTQDCQDILGDILQEVVVCSEAGVHGPNWPETSCVSKTCSLGGVSPPQDISLVLANLVSNNQLYNMSSMGVSCTQIFLLNVCCFTNKYEILLNA